MKFYIDGAEVGSVSMPDAMNLNGNIHIMANSDTPANAAFHPEGQIDEFRISKGIARWTAPFTPPTAPYTID